MELFIGAIVSVLVQLIKKLADTTKLGSIALAIIFSFIGGAAYYFLKSHTDLLAASGHILGYASAIYAIIIKPLLQND